MMHHSRPSLGAAMKAAYSLPATTSRKCIFPVVTISSNITKSVEQLLPAPFDGIKLMWSLLSQNFIPLKLDTLLDKYGGYIFMLKALNSFLLSNRA
jgi:hypothetical protein